MPRAHDSSRMRMGVLEKPLPATPPAAHPPTLHSAQPLLPLTGKLESGEGTLQPHVKRPCGTGSKVRDPNFKACGESPTARSARKSNAFPFQYSECGNRHFVVRNRQTNQVWTLQLNKVNFQSAFFSQTNKGNQQRPGSTRDKGHAPWTLDKDEPLGTDRMEGTLAR
ncbi:hypothetical protein B0T13DRAFT_18090 [Neurospora crassa]|nr:hypothetical protein B0T13DRAFT_18090 [Neurospora crassa]